MIMSKVVIELRFTRRIPKSVLEGAVEKFAKIKGNLISPYRKYDPNAFVRVWYDDMGKVPKVAVADMLPRPKNPFKRMFRNKGAKK